MEDYKVTMELVAANVEAMTISEVTVNRIPLTKNIVDDIILRIQNQGLENLHPGQRLVTYSALEEENKRTKEENRRVEHERSQAEEQKRKVEEELRKSEEERRKADGEFRRVDGELRRLHGELRILHGELRRVEGKLREVEEERRRLEVENRCLKRGLFGFGAGSIIAFVIVLL